MAPKAAAAPAASHAVDPQDKYVTIELPAGITAEDLIPPEATPADAAQAEPAVEAEPTPEPTPPPPARQPLKAGVQPTPPAPPVVTPPRRRSDATRAAVVPLPELLRSRDRVTALQGDNARLRSENHRLRAEGLQRRMLEQARIDPVTITDQDREVLRRIAADQSDIAKIQVQTAEFLAAKFNAVRQAEASRRSGDLEQSRLADSEDAIREKHAREKVAPGWDYDSVGTASGIFRAFTVDQRTGTYYEPATVADIKAAANPAERAYELGLVRLREMGWAPDEPEAEPEPEPAPAPVAPARSGRAQEPPAPTPAPEPRRASATDVEAAERRGERRGAAAVVNRAEERGRGIRHLPSAGGGPARVQVTAAYLDQLKDRDPDKWLEILQTNPTLEYEYMTGSLT